LKNAKGFSLFETLLAVVILASALLLLTNSWSSGFLRVRKTQQQFEIATLLERKMTEIEIEYRGKPLDDIPEEKGEDFGSDYPQYSWRLTSQKLELPDISSTMAAQEGGIDQFTQTMIKTLTETISKSVKEVTVTVIYNVQPKPLEYSITTYFVDYNTNLNLSVPMGGVGP
jgi:general secretion pathway protein I